MISEIRRGRTGFDALPLFHQRGFSAGLFTGEIGTVFPYNIFIRGNRQRRTSSEQWTGGKAQGGKAPEYKIRKGNRSTEPVRKVPEEKSGEKYLQAVGIISAGR